MIGKGHPKKSTLQVRQQKIVQEEWGGALGAAMDGRSESILSRASALRWQSGEGCKWVLRTVCPSHPAHHWSQVLPCQRMSPQEGGPCRFPW